MLFQSLITFFNRQSNQQSALSQKKALHFPFDFDRWYPKLHAFTFHSHILPIPIKTAQAMVHFYQTKYLGRLTLTQRDIKTIKNLKSQLDIFFSQIPKYQSVFVRMSNRSAKDGMPYSPTTSAYTALLKNRDVISLNDLVAQLSDLQMTNLQCRHSDDVLNLLLTSERVYLDLLLALECHVTNKQDQWSTSIILRDWQPNLRLKHEFRVFVYQGRITAISQYDPYCKYADFNHQDRCDQIVQQCQSFIQQIHPHIDLNTYIIDLALIDNITYVIELNPFHPTTSGSLFSWSEDEDILFGRLSNQAPILRVRQSELSDEILQNIVNLIENNQSQATEPYDELLERTQESLTSQIFPKTCGW